MNNRKSLTFLILVISPLLFNCGKPAPNEDERKESPSVTPVRIQTGEKYVVDTKETEVKWKCSMAFSRNGHFGYVNPSKGELRIENGQLLSGSVEIDMNTIADERHNGDNGLVEHLKSADFFDTEKFPTAAFAITLVGPAKGDSIQVTGFLSIKGIAHPVTIPTQFVVKDGVATAICAFAIDRTQWDVRYGSGKFFENLANETISDKIEFEIRLVARKG